MIENDPTRCRRGEGCADATELRDAEERFIGKVGALLSALDVCGLCGACVRFARYATSDLRRDWDDLDEAKYPTLEVRLRHPDLPSQPRIKLHSPAPLRVDAVDLRDLIAHEVDWICASVVDAADAGREWPHDSRDRLDEACQLIIIHFDTLLTLPATAHPARSIAAEPWEGHPPDALTCEDGVWWVHRDGPDMALRLWDLHTMAELFTGRAGSDLLPVPCPACQRKSLVREHRANRVYCRRPKCDLFMGDDAYEELRGKTPTDFLAWSRQLAEDAT